MKTDTPPGDSTRMPRRQLLQWFAAVAAADLSATALPGFAQQAQPATAATTGYGTDPLLATAYNPGDVWPLILSDAERKATAALADVILPADDLGPAAGELKLVDFIDEWLSAPYPKQVSDREAILPGLTWLDKESQSRFQKIFADLNAEQQTAICDDIVAEKPKTPELAKAAGFFQRFTNIATGAYYSTPQGWSAIGYVGNVASGTFEGPPQEVLDRLDLEQTVKD